MTDLYVKLIDGQIVLPPKNANGVINYNLNIELLIQDGYKLFVKAQPPEPTNRKNHIGYRETKDQIREIIVWDETQKEADARVLNELKALKIQENDNKRDEALNQGVEYKNVLFDSDTDQKVNLIAMVESMNASQKIIWFGKDNQPLECTKQDLLSIGGLITQLHSFCWGKNYEIKQAINACQTIEEIENIIIDYKEI